MRNDDNDNLCIWWYIVKYIINLVIVYGVFYFIGFVEVSLLYVFCFLMLLCLLDFRDYLYLLDLFYYYMEFVNGLFNLRWIFEIVLLFVFLMLFCML